MREKTWGRSDIWSSLVAAVLLAAALGWVLNTFVLARIYGGPSVPEGEVGGYAAETTPRAESLADMEENAVFTVEYPGVSYQFGTGTMVDGRAWRLLELPSGESIAAVYNEEGLRRVVQDMYHVSTFLPVGTLVYAPPDAIAVEGLGGTGALSVTDRYVDMLGAGAEAGGQDPGGLILGAFTLIVAGAGFFLIHLIGVRRGRFPRLRSY